MHILDRYDAWVFDMDGTLTVPQLDFSEVRRRLGFAPGTPILEGIEECPLVERARLMKIVADWEWEGAERALIAPGAKALLEAIAERGLPRGILTRNRRDIALVTLESVGLRSFFHDAEILGRDEATPKPAPDGVERLLEGWPKPARSVMVGDYVHDMEAGHRAGCETILVGPECPVAWRPWVDWWGADLAAIDMLEPIS